MSMNGARSWTGCYALKSTKAPTTYSFRDVGKKINV